MRCPAKTQWKANETRSITKTGNLHLRRIVVEAAWSYRRHHVSGIILFPSALFATKTPTTTYCPKLLVFRRVASG